MIGRSNGKNRFKRVAALCLAAALICTLFSGCYLFPEEEEKLYAPTLTVKDVTYSSIPAEKGTIERWDSGKGTIQTTNYENYAFLDGGTLKQIYVRAGSVVKAGDILVELDTREIDAQISHQEYVTERARLVYEVEVAEHGASSPQASLAKLDYDYENGVLEAIKAQKGESELRSNIDGVVTFTSSIANPGTYVEPGRTLVTVSDTSELVIMYESKNLVDINIGMEAKCSVGGGVFEFVGTVKQTPKDVPVDASANERKYVYITCNDVPYELATIGAGVQCSILLERKEDVIVLPTSHISSTKTRTFVRVLVDGLPEERDVVLGINNGTKYEIKSGIKVGDQIVG